MRLNEYAPAVGDLLCWGRESGIDYDHQKAGNYHGHTDIVVQVDQDAVWVIGGNVGNSVTKRPIPTTSKFLDAVVLGGENLFGIMQNRVDLVRSGTAAGTAKLEGASESASVIEVAWGKTVGLEFKNSVVGIAARLGCDPSHLMAAMAFETGESFSPSIQNPKSKATGLIQFMPTTALDLGTTIDALAKMSALDQLKYVEKYLTPYANRMRSLSDMYMAVLYPKCVEKVDSTILFERGTVAYSQNAGLDVNNDGFITKGEATSKVQSELDKGLAAGVRG
jgi:hypothetical protein